uniref:Rho-GAP domain-containing protein n=1 Tax=Ditylenchus dipsaci TaxID=166011 RepID=A0A915CWN0_9BILA
MQTPEGAPYRPIPKPRKSLANKINGNHCTSNGTVSHAPPLPPRLPFLPAFNTLPALPSPVVNGESTRCAALPNGYNAIDDGLNREEDKLDPVEMNSYSYIGPVFERLVALDRRSTTNSCTESIVNGENVCFSGWVKLLTSHHSKKEDRRRCWAVIRANQLSFMENDETETPFLGPFDSYKCVFTGRNTADPADIVLLLRGSQLLKIIPEENVDFWLVFLAKCHCPQSETLQSSLKNVDIGGKLWWHMDRGLASVSKRVLYYWIQGFDAIFEADIRKIILIKRDIPIADYCNRIENSVTGPILIARKGSSLYLQAESDQATDLWFLCLDAELRKSGTTLEENRLTDDDVPVIVDKCLKLVSTFGLNQPGIYRKNGSAAEARDLLRDFRLDPYNVQLRSVTDESINAVADNLRSFFRQLQSPLIPSEIHDDLYVIFWSNRTFGAPLARTKGVPLARTKGVPLARTKGAHSPEAKGSTRQNQRGPTLQNQGVPGGTNELSNAFQPPEVERDVAEPEVKGDVAVQIEGLPSGLVVGSAVAVKREKEDLCSRRRDVRRRNHICEWTPGSGEWDPFASGEWDPSGSASGTLCFWRVGPLWFCRVGPFGSGEWDPFGSGEWDPFGSGEWDPFGSGEWDPFDTESREDIKIQGYRKVIFSLPKVYFSTLKKLLAHLQQITAHSDKNLASVDNICKVFGPTVFSVDKVDEQVSIESYAKTSLQIFVMKELLTNFDQIFQISPEEIRAKCKLDEIQDQKQNPKTPRAEGFLTPIHLMQRDNKCFNVQSELTASQVVAYKKEKLAYQSISDSLALFEVVKNGQLQRRICEDETLTSIVLGRWLEWDMHSECFLLLKKDEYPFQPQNIRPFADDVKIADPGSKSFRTVHLKVESGTKVVMYSKNMKPQNEWTVDDMLWFVGYESERKPPYQHALTFFLTGKQKSKYKAKMPGYCVAFKDEVQQIQWLNSVIICKQEYLPTPLIQI